MNTLRLDLFVVLVLLLKSSLYSQTATIRGKILNEKNNEPIPFANVVIVGTNIGSTSNFDGEFVITGIQPGFYKLTASSVGFEQYFSEEIQVTTARPAFVEIKMKEKTIELQGIEIKSELFKKRDESPTSMRTISISEIEKNPGANRDISKIVQNLPGVGSTVSFRNDLIVRGGGPNENRFYIDNIEIPNLNHFATQGASGGPVSIVNADFISEVDFYTSSFPSNKGNALSSVMDMKMIEGNKDRLATKLTVGASDFGLTLNGPTGENSSLLFSVRRSYLQFLFSAIGLPFLPVYNDFQFKQKFNFDKKNQLTIIGIGAYDVSRLNLNANETEEQRYILSYLPETDQWNYTIGTAYQHFSDKHIDLYVLSRNMLRNKSFKYLENNKNNPKIQDYVSDEIENKFRYERTLYLSTGKLSFGAGFEYAKYLNSTQQLIFIDNSVFNIDYDSFIDLFKYSTFGQFSSKINLLKYTIGLRIDGNTFTPKMQNPLNQLSPRIGFSYPLSENINFNLSSGRYYQLPAYTTLGFRNNQNVLVNKKNNITYIASNQVNTGLEYLFNQNTQLTVEGFYKNYENYPFSLRDSISLANKGGDFGVVGDEEVKSIGEGRAYGFEILTRAKKVNNYAWLLSYTFVYSEFKNLQGKYISSAWDQRHILNLLITKNFKKNWTVGMKWRFAGGLPYTPYDIEKSEYVLAWNAQGRGYLDYSKYNTQKLSPSHQLDVRIDKEFYAKKFSFNIYLDVQNVYNFKAESKPNLVRVEDANKKPIIVNPDASIEEQKYKLKLLKNTTGTVLPTIGIIFEF